MAKSIADASWGLFLAWLRYYSGLHRIPVIAVPPHYTTQDCSGILPDGTRCTERVKKSLSMRTHVCPRCGLVLDRDWNAALIILWAGLTWLAAHRTAGQAGTGSGAPEQNASGQTASTPRLARARRKRAG